MNYQYLNVACGGSFIDDELWLNLDYAPITAKVTQANLLGKFPCPDSSIKLVYSSHFIEHIPYEKVAGFLQECYRVLQKEGMIRLVLPDLENICREYLKCRDHGEHEKADFCIIELLDQCVRTESGGRLGKYWQVLKQNPQESKAMIEYVKYRTGEDILNCHQNQSIPRINFFRKVQRKIIHKFQSARINFLTRLLPSAFREQNVSFTTIGEKHAWMWDFYSLSNQLNAVGFKEISRVTFDTTGINGFPLIPLDMNADGSPRKGYSSLYVEARK